jgi:CRP/FNR family transcriptional regulator, cyclic AMP receptor protein
METSDKATLLSQIDFFKGCTQRQLEDIAKLVRDRDVHAGDILCEQGESGTDAFVIVEGDVAVFFNDKQIAEIGPGEVVGELSVERGGIRTATLKAMTPVRALVVDAREVESVLSSDPKSAQRLGPRNPGDEIYPERRA